MGRSRRQEKEGHGGLEGFTLSDKGSHRRVLHKHMTKFCVCFKGITLLLFSLILFF